MGFETVFYDGNLYPSTDRKILAGTRCDEYAFYYEEQIYPKFAVKYSTHLKDGSEQVVEYTGNHNFQNTDFSELLKVLAGPDKERRTAYRIIGDLSRDFNSKTT